MFAVIRTGGKQYRVAPNDVIEIERVGGEAGEIIQFGEVLMLGGETPQLGGPLIEGASVAAEVLAQKRAPKVIVFKKKRRKNYRRKHGHRQLLTAVRITEILTEGRAPSKVKPERAKAPKPEAADKAASQDEETHSAEPESQPKRARKAPAKKTAAKKPAKSASKAKSAE